MPTGATALPLANEFAPTREMTLKSGARHTSLVQLDDTRVALDTVMNALTPL